MATWGAHITWKEFKEVFLEKYFPHSVCIQKEIEFLQLWQGEMTVSEYVVKFESLARFSHYLKDNPQNDWKTLKDLRRRLALMGRNSIAGMTSFKSSCDLCP